MKKLTLILAVALVSFNCAFAQQDAKAKTILDQVSAKTKSFSTIKIGFTFERKTKDDAQKSEKSAGTLLLKGQKYQLSLMGNTIYSDGKTVWTHMIDEKEVSIANVDGSGQMFNPAQMLTIYEKGFKYKFIQERFENGRALYIIDLYPEDAKKSEFSSVRLTILKDKSQIWKIEYFAKDKNIYVITVNTFEPNVALADSVFVFDKSKFPGIQVIDER
ncbi:MAG: outer membrane lipoprotein carrier protein LolA [Bacteroidales bacterium]|nr:outer membrane lipoprotein carrier protein LolA [Bacteroidales bacterium]